MKVGVGSFVVPPLGPLVIVVFGGEVSIETSVVASRRSARRCPAGAVDVAAHQLLAGVEEDLGAVAEEP